MNLPHRYPSLHDRRPALVVSRSGTYNVPSSSPRVSNLATGWRKHFKFKVIFEAVTQTRTFSFCPLPSFLYLFNLTWTWISTERWEPSPPPPRGVTRRSRTAWNSSIFPWVILILFIPQLTYHKLHTTWLLCHNVWINVHLGPLFETNHFPLLTENQASLQKLVNSNRRLYSLLAQGSDAVQRLQYPTQQI